MPSFAVPTAPRPLLPVSGGGEVPVRRVYCIGRNYAEHAREMGHDPDREPPFFFQKNPENLDTSGIFPYPTHSTDVHHEIELAVVLRSGGQDIAVEAALDHVFGYAIALDMTRRDLQAAMKKAGRPWEVGKAFERSAPVSAIRPAAEIGHPGRGRITLQVNDETRQDGDLAQMIWSVPEMISALSEFFELAAGDVILTGTPAGVGPVQRGDALEGTIEGVGNLSVRVV
ncbi:MAG: fumarylacetoacetate hydrolase family protein [Rhodobacter sp.]|nr:fumarylacetoacetate hydrolase family protein [Rhodobacter sp.]